MAEPDTLESLIEDARRVPRQRTQAPRVIDLTEPPARHEIVIPAATVTMLEDYELYVD